MLIGPSGQVLLGELSAALRRGCLGASITGEHFAPASQPVPQNDEVVHTNAVYDEIGILRVVDAEQRLAKRVLVEPGVGALGESEQVTFGVLAAG